MTTAKQGRPNPDASLLETIREVRAFALQCFSEASGSHDWDHTLRVRNLCLRIGEAERGDPEVLEISAYLHDIGRSAQDASRGAVCHAEKGAEMARDFLESLPLSDRLTENVIHSILTHRFRGEKTPESLEARILYDADKLDAIGAVGVSRAYHFAGEIGARLHNPDLAPESTVPYSTEDTGYREYKLKLAKIRDMMLTGAGRRMAEDRHAFMENFFNRFLMEIRGVV